MCRFRDDDNKVEAERLAIFVRIELKFVEYACVVLSDFFHMCLVAIVSIFAFLDNNWQVISLAVVVFCRNLSHFGLLHYLIAGTSYVLRKSTLSMFCMICLGLDLSQSFMLNLS